MEVQLRSVLVQEGFDIVLEYLVKLEGSPFWRLFNVTGLLQVKMLEYLAERFFACPVRTRNCQIGRRNEEQLIEVSLC